MSCRPPHRVDRRNRRGLEHPRRLAAYLFSLPVGIALVIGVSSCGSSGTTSTAPSAVPDKCQVQAQLEHATFPASGGSGALQVSTNRECSWNARSDAAWLTVSSGTSGQGDGTVQFTVAGNNDPATRTGGISVNDQRMQVSQEGKPCDIHLSSVAEQVDPSGGDRTLQVTASSAQCTWTAAADVPWITITSGGNGTGSGSVVFKVAPTTGPTRVGTVTVAGQHATVTQSAGCSVAVDPSTYSAPASGGPAEVNVRTGDGCSWSAVSDSDWVTVNSGSGSGSGVVKFSVAAWSGVSRTASIRIGSAALTVSQASGCSVSASPSSLSLGAQAGSGTIQVDSAAGCAWTATSGADWITISAGSSGSGAGQVQIAIAANSGPARQGSVSISDRTISIAQAAGCTFSVAPSSQNVPATGGGGPLSVTTGSGCGWTASSSVSWITLSATSGTGAGQVQITVAANTGPARQGSVTISDHAVSIAQASGCTFGIAPPSQDVPGTGGGGSVSVTTGADCPWTASSGVSWISLSTPAGTGPGSVGFSVAPSNEPPRSGTVTIAGSPFTVQQASPCTWTFSPPNHVFDANGGNGNVLVILNGGGCTWTAVSNADWITVTAGASGAGDGLLQFIVPPNPGPPRTGTLTVAGLTYVVVEGGR
jgi:hypothetical protein